MVSLVENLPVAGSTRRILMPPQKLPHVSHTLTGSSTTRLGSIAFQSSFSAYERSTSPWSTHAWSGLDESSVRDVARPMAESRLPKVETE